MVRGLAEPFAARQFANKAHPASFHLTERCGSRASRHGRFNRRKMEDERRRAAEKESAARRATDAQLLEDADRLIAAWNDRQAKRMPMLFSPTIGAAITARYWFLWVRCPACRSTSSIGSSIAIPTQPAVKSEYRIK